MPMKKAWLLTLTLFLACQAAPSFILPPEDMTVIPGGISDVRPFFGKMFDSQRREVGDFLLATCGCGDWRVLLSFIDGSPQRQFPVRFYAAGPYTPTGSVTVYGAETDQAADGIVDQDAGQTEGRLALGFMQRTFLATRGDAHAQEVEACVLCHIGENPIWPQPPNHPTYVPGVTDCFMCHTVTIE